MSVNIKLIQDNGGLQWYPLNGWKERHVWKAKLVDAGLIDLPMLGYSFTWFKSLGTARAVEEKLDRALTDASWCDLFQEASLECLTTTSSDHYPLWLSCKVVVNPQRVSTKFRFENSWLVEPEFGLFVDKCQEVVILMKI